MSVEKSNFTSWTQFDTGSFVKRYCELLIRFAHRIAGALLLGGQLADGDVAEIVQAYFVRETERQRRTNDAVFERYRADRGTTFKTYLFMSFGSFMRDELAKQATARSHVVVAIIDDDHPVLQEARDEFGKEELAQVMAEARPHVLRSLKTGNALEETLQARVLAYFERRWPENPPENPRSDVDIYKELELTEAEGKTAKKHLRYTTLREIRARLYEEQLDSEQIDAILADLARRLDA
jgi:hypothetical protein